MTDTRRHRLQMKLAEIAAIEAFVHTPRRWACAENGHLQERLREKQITVAGILAAIRGKVVEVNRNGQDVRAVFRSAEAGPQTVVVVSLVHFRIVTAWKNDADDRHGTLNRSEYTWGQDIRTVLNLS